MAHWPSLLGGGKGIIPCARRSDDTDARYPQARRAPTRSIFKRAHVRQPRTTAVNPACGCSRDRNEEQDSGLRRSSVERNKEGDGFVRFRWGEIKKQEADGGGARLMIETGAELPIGLITYSSKTTREIVKLFFRLEKRSLFLNT
jgi:hypothetical protein